MAATTLLIASLAVLLDTEAGRLDANDAAVDAFVDGSSGLAALLAAANVDAPPAWRRWSLRRVDAATKSVLGRMLYPAFGSSRNALHTTVERELARAARAATNTFGQDDEAAVRMHLRAFLATEAHAKGQAGLIWEHWGVRWGAEKIPLLRSGQ